MTKSNKYLIYFFGALGGLLFGYDTGVVSGALLFIKNDIPLTDFLEGLVVSSLLFGAIFGAAFSGTLSDRWGRKRVVFVISLIFIVGAIACALSENVTSLVIFRIILGIAVGGASVIVPVYLSEMAPTHIRGKLGTLNNLMIVIGILMAYVVNYFFAPYGAWRWMIGLAAVPAILLLIGIFFMPESPRWLIKHGRENEARRVMKLTHDESDMEDDLEAMKKVDTDTLTTAGLLKAKWIRPMLIIGIALAIFQQAAGINTVIYYAPTIFVEAGLGTSSSILSTMGIGVVNVIMCLVAMYLIDRVGRKKLLIWGSIGTSLSLLLLWGILSSAGVTTTTSWLLVILLGVYIVFFQASWGPVVWVLIPELFPSNARGAATGLATMCLTITNLIVSLIFPVLLSGVGIAWVFMIFGVVCVLSFFFAFKFVPETKGKSLEEIEGKLRKRFKVDSEKSKTLVKKSTI